MLVEKASVRRLLLERSTNGLGHRLFPPATSIIHSVLKRNLKIFPHPKNSDFDHIPVTYFLFGEKESRQRKTTKATWSASKRTSLCLIGGPIWNLCLPFKKESRQRKNTEAA